MYNYTAERNPLHYTIYERVDLPRPWQQLWPYRSKVTLETFFHKLNLQWDDDNNPKYPVLYYLCKHVRPDLCVLLYQQVLVI